MMDEIETDERLNFMVRYRVGEEIVVPKDVLINTLATEFDFYLSRYPFWNVKIIYIGNYGVTLKLIHNSQSGAESFGDRTISVSFKKFRKITY